MGKFARTSTTNPLFVMGKKGLALVFMLALVGAVMLPACSSSDAGSSLGGSSAEQQASIDVTVTLAAVEDAGIEAQEITVSIPEGGTAYDALVESGLEIVAADSDYGMFVSAIAGLEGSNASGWVYTLNGEQVMDACDDLVLSEGDVVEWSYTTW